MTCLSQVQRMTNAKISGCGCEATGCQIHGGGGMNLTRSRSNTSSVGLSSGLLSDVSWKLSGACRVYHVSEVKRSVN